MSKSTSSKYDQPTPDTQDTGSQDSGSQDTGTHSYEEAREELVEVVRKLEAGGTTLEESLALWERGEVLARSCQDWLDGARRRLEEVKEQTVDR